MPSTKGENMLKNMLTMMIIPTYKCQSADTSSYEPIRRKSKADDFVLKSILSNMITRAKSVVSKIVCLIM